MITHVEGTFYLETKIKSFNIPVTFTSRFSFKAENDFPTTITFTGTRIYGTYTFETGRKNPRGQGISICTTGPRRYL